MQIFLSWKSDFFFSYKRKQMEAKMPWIMVVPGSESSMSMLTASPCQSTVEPCVVALWDGEDSAALLNEG